MECKICKPKPLAYGTKKFNCSMCGEETFASLSSTDVCLSCSEKYSICQTCGCIVTKELK